MRRWMSRRFLPLDALFGREQIYFVPDVKGRPSGDAEFGKNLGNSFIELLMMGAGNIADVDDERGLLYFFEGCAKGIHQTFGECTDKSNSVWKQYAAAGRQAKSANGGIESGEHAR